jgi:hypothetical protein
VPLPEDTRLQRIRKHRVSLFGMTIAVILIATVGGAQTTPSISILSPKNETVVQPGQTLQITATSSGVTQVAIIGTKIGPTALQPGGTSLNFSVVLPANMRPGRYYLHGVGTTAGGALVQSTAVSVRVQSVGVSALQINPSVVMLLAPGRQILLDVEGTTTQGQVRMFPQDMMFSSANPGVASVDTNGIVTGQSAGTTQILASFSTGNDTLSASTTVTVGGAVRGDLNNDGLVDIDDLNILDSVLNTPANGPNDARDLNHDGVINALDARILVTLCTYPRCATHP